MAVLGHFCLYGSEPRTGFPKLQAIAGQQVADGTAQGTAQVILRIEFLLAPQPSKRSESLRRRRKPDFGWTPKAYKEREIPIPDKLVRSLKGWKANADATCPLVFPNSNCSPNGHFLRMCMCKAVAKRAELPEDDFWLHKFRATFATRALRSGVDRRTVQMWMGHTDLERTMRYLKPNRGKAVREKVNGMFDSCNEKTGPVNTCTSNAHS